MSGRLRWGLNACSGKRVLLVEDEMMIRMLLEGMLDDLGHTVAGEAGAIDEALALAKNADFDIALLDVNLNGRPITPVVEILIKRGLPFVFASRLWPSAACRSPIAAHRPCRSRSRSKRWPKPSTAASPGP